jgi:cation transport ATPase
MDKFIRGRSKVSLMDAEGVFANIVVIAVFAIIFVVLTGGNASPLIEVLPTIVIVTFVIALGIAILNAF